MGVGGEVLDGGGEVQLAVATIEKVRTKKTLELEQRGFCLARLDFWEIFNTFFNTVSSAAPQIPMFQKILGLNPGL